MAGSELEEEEKAAVAKDRNRLPLIAEFQDALFVVVSFVSKLVIFCEKCVDLPFRFEEIYFMRFRQRSSISMLPRNEQKIPAFGENEAKPIMFFLSHPGSGATSSTKEESAFSIGYISETLNIWLIFS